LPHLDPLTPAALAAAFAQAFDRESFSSGAGHGGAPRGDSSRSAT